MADWICRKCGNEVMTASDNPPLPIPWSDGHKCSMIRLDDFTPEARKEIIRHIEANL